MDLSEISFKVNTDALTAAANKAEALGVAVEDLAKSFTKLSKDSATANRDAARTQVILAKGAAEAEVILAKAETERSKASLNAAKEALAKAKAEGAGEEATRSATKAVQEHISMLEREESILQFMTEGYSRGQAAKLAYAKASGVANDEIKQIGDTLQQQRTLMGGDPFDKSLGSLKSLQNELEVTRRVQGMFTEGLALTQKQMEGLALDQIRLAEANKIAGRATSEGMRELKSAYLQTANAVNTLDQADKNILKSQRDAVSANAAIEKELNRVKYALQETNSELNKGASNALFRFEQNLKRSGKTLAEQKVLMDDYRKSLLSLEKNSAGRQTDYITRAVGPQITDIMVGLVTGQAPLTVMLQQGGQLRDQFALAGVEAGKMGDVMRTAAAGMVVSVKDTAKAVGTMLVGAFVDAGSAVNNFFMKYSGMNYVMDQFKRSIVSQGEIVFGQIGTINKMATAWKYVTGTVLAASAAAFIALAVAAYQVTKEQNELAKSLTITGAQMGLTTAEAIKLAQSLDIASTSSAITFLSELAKKGYDGSAGLKSITKAAVDLEKYAGIALKDTAEAYTKLQDKPLNGLLELAKNTGQVTKETIDYAISLELAGEKVKLIQLAQDQFVEATVKATKAFKDQMDPMSQLWVIIKEGIDGAWESVKNYSRTGPVLGAAITVVGSLAKVVNALSTAMLMLGESATAGAASMMNTAAGLNPFSGTTMKQALEDNKQVIKYYSSEMKRLNAEADATDKRITAAMNHTGKATAEVTKTQSDYAAARMSGLADVRKAHEIIEKYETKQMTRQQAMKKAEDDYRAANKQAVAADVEMIRKAAGITWDKSQKKPDNSAIIEANKEISAYNKAAEFYNDLMGISEGKTKSYNNELEYLNNLRDDYVKTGGKFGISQENYAWALDKLNKLQPGYIKQLKDQAKAEKEVADGHELIARLLGKADDVGAEYYKNQDELFKLLDKGFDSTLILQALAANEKITPAFRKNEAAVNDLNKQFAESNKQLLDQDEALKNEAANLWDTNDVRERKNALLKVEIQYQKELASVLDAIAAKGLTDPAEIEKALNNAVSNKNFGLKLINDTATVESMKKAKEEFDKFSSEISGIVTDALFHGGKDGAVRIRKAIVAQLLKPVEVVVNAVVNTLLGNVLGSIGGGSSAIGSASGLANTLSNAGSLGAAATGYLGLTGATTAGIAANTALAGTIGITSAEAAAGAIAAGQAAATGSIFADALAFAFDPVTLGIGALVAILTSLDDSGTMHTGGLGSYSSSQGSSYGSSVKSQLNFDLANADITQAASDAAVGISSSIVKMLDATAGAFGQQAGYFAATAFADDTSKDGAWGALMIKLGDKIVTDWGQGLDKWPGKEFANGEQGTKEYATALATDVRTALEQMDLPDWASKLLNNLGDAPTIENLSNVVTSINQIQAAIVFFGDTLGYSTDSVTALVNIFGDANTAMQAMNTFYEGFYSEQEKNTILTKNLTKSFAALGEELPTTRDAFRALVDTAVEAGDPQKVASLLNLQVAFGTLNPIVDATTNSIESLTKEGDNLKLELMNAQMQMQGSTITVEEYNQAVQDLATEGFSPAELAIWKLNQGMTETISELKAAKAQVDNFNSAMGNLSSDQTNATIALMQAQGNSGGASALQQLTELAGLTKDLTAEQADAVTIAYNQIQATKAQTAVLTERAGLEKELLQAQGNTVALRELELAGYDDSNKELKRSIWAIADKAEADAKAAKLLEEQTAAATKLAEDAASAMKRITDERAGLEKQLLTLQGDTVALRNLELIALDPSNQALQLQIWLLEDQATALQKANDIATERTGLEKQLLQAQGKTAEIRALELAALDPSNRALQEQIWAIEDATAATTELTNAWQSVTNSIFDEVNRIRGLLGQGSTASLASAQSAFNSASILARAGDKTSAENLPALSQALLEVAASQANSLTDLKRIQAVTANSLEQTGNILNNSSLSSSGSTVSVATGLGTVSTIPTSGSTALTTALSNADVVTAINNLNANIDLLRAEVRADVTHNAKTAKLLDRVIPDGQSVQVTVLA